MPAAAHAVGPRYPISPGSAPDWSGTPGIPGTSSSSNRVPCEMPCEPAAAEALLSETRPPPSPLVTATPTSTGADYPRYSHRKPTRAAASTTPRGASRHSGAAVPYQGAIPVCGRSGGPAEVLGRDGVEELPELLDFRFVVFLLLRDGHARLVQDLLAGEDLRAGAQRQRDRVGRPRADLSAVGEDQVRVEDPVPQRGDVHRSELDVQHFEHVTEQIMRQRAKGNHALLGEGDRCCLDRSDPDRQVPVALRLLEQDDGAVRWHLDPDADDLHLPHYSSVLTCLGTSAWPPLPLPRYTRNRPEADRSPPAAGPVASGPGPGM